MHLVGKHSLSNMSLSLNYFELFKQVYKSITNCDSLSVICNELFVKVTASPGTDVVQSSRGLPLGSCSLTSARFVAMESRVVCMTSSVVVKRMKFAAPYAFVVVSTGVAIRVRFLYAISHRSGVATKTASLFWVSPAFVRHRGISPRIEVTYMFDLQNLSFVLSLAFRTCNNKDKHSLS